MDFNYNIYYNKLESFNYTMIQHEKGNWSFVYYSSFFIAKLIVFGVILDFSQKNKAVLARNHSHSQTNFAFD